MQPKPTDLLTDIVARHRGVAEELSEPSTARFAWAISVQWLVIIGSVVAVAHCPSWWLLLLLPIAWAVVAGRQHALIVLMHDASHIRMCKPQWLSDLIGDWALAFPLGVSTTCYRARHLGHHRFAGTDDDPDWEVQREDEDWHWPKSYRDARMVIVRDFLGLNGPKIMRMLRHWSPLPRLFRRTPEFTTAHKLSLFIYLALTATLLIVSGYWWAALLVWLPAQATFLSGFVRLRAIAEHMEVENAALHPTRNVRARWWERLFIAPLNVNLHLDHHIFPSVPHYALPALHRHLLTDPAYVAHAEESVGYWGNSQSVVAHLTATPA